MKNLILLVISLLSLISTYGQKGKNPKDEFTYEKVRVIENDKGILPLSGTTNSTLTEEKSVTTKSSNSGIGGTLGELSVSLSGGATYNVPIAVPAGINGVAPEVSLTYNSQSGNGLAGYGWNISGASVITRIPSTKFHDGIIDGVDFDSNDRFALDGQRLILKSGVYGGNGALYETENYSTLKIVSHGVSSYGANYGPEYFIVYYPDGSVAHYGHSSDSKSKTNYAITYWQNPQGVRVSYQYTTSFNTLSISKINYGGRNGSNQINEIQFVYSDRFKKELAYVGGVEFKRHNVLNKIKVYSNGIGYRNYHLYTERNYLHYDQLTSITEYSGDDSKQHSSIRFKYNKTNVSVNYNDITTNLALVNIEQRNAEAVSLDLTGNGKMDFIVYPKRKSQKINFGFLKTFKVEV